MKTHLDLDVWKRSIEFVTLIYQSTENFPKSEIYGITSQIRRSAVSIPSNIAEGAGRTSKKEFSHFLSIFVRLFSRIRNSINNFRQSKLPRLWFTKWLNLKTIPNSKNDIRT